MPSLIRHISLPLDCTETPFRQILRKESARLNPELLFALLQEINVSRCFYSAVATATGYGGGGPKTICAVPVFLAALCLRRIIFVSTSDLRRVMIFEIIRSTPTDSFPFGDSRHSGPLSASVHFLV